MESYVKLQVRHGRPLCAQSLIQAGDVRRLEMNPLSCTRLVRQEPAGRQSPRTKHISTLGAEAAWRCHSLRLPSGGRRESVHMNLTSGAQVFQPCSQKLV